MKPSYPPGDSLRRMSALRANDRCIVILDSGPLLAEIIRVLWHAGSAFALLQPDIPQIHLEGLVATYRPTMLVRQDHEGRMVLETGPNADHPRPVTDGSITVVTSGTTGQPKGVVIPRAAVIGNALKTARIHGFGTGRPHGTCLGLYHVNALVMSLLGTVLTGEQLVYEGSASAHEYFAALSRAAVRTASANPRVLRRIVAEAPPWPRDLDYVITAAGPCGKNLATEFYELYGPRLRQGYGMSEAVNFSFMMPQITDRREFMALYTEVRPPVGRPIEETTFRIIDGELQLRSPDMMSGYLHEPTPLSMKNGWLATGDYAEDRDGFVVLLGRVSERLTAPGVAGPPGLAEDSLDLPVEVGDYAVVQIPGREAIALFTSRLVSLGEVEKIVQSGMPIGVICAGDLMLSPGGKVRRSLMASASLELLQGVESALRSEMGMSARLLGALAQGRAPTDVAFKTRLLACGCTVHYSSFVSGLAIEPSCDHDGREIWKQTQTAGYGTYVVRESRPRDLEGVSVARWVRTGLGDAILNLRSSI